MKAEVEVVESEIVIIVNVLRRVVTGARPLGGRSLGRRWLESAGGRDGIVDGTVTP